MCLPLILMFCLIFFQGWVSNVAPWLVSIPSSIFAGFLSGQLVKSGIAPGKARKIIFVSINQIVYLCHFHCQNQFNRMNYIAAVDAEHKYFLFGGWALPTGKFIIQSGNLRIPFKGSSR